MRIELSYDELAYADPKGTYIPQRWDLYDGKQYVGTLRAELIYGSNDRFKSSLALLIPLMKHFGLSVEPEPYSELIVPEHVEDRTRLIFIACSSSGGLAALRHARTILEVMTNKEVWEWERLLTASPFKKQLATAFRNWLRTKKGKLK